MFNATEQARYDAIVARVAEGRGMDVNDARWLCDLTAREAHRNRGLRRALAQMDPCLYPHKLCQDATRAQETESKGQI
jgi:hypothetical protein